MTNLDDGYIENEHAFKVKPILIGKTCIGWGYFGCYCENI